MTKFDGALRSGCGPSPPAALFTLNGTKLPLSPATSASSKGHCQRWSGRTTSRARPRPQWPLLCGANWEYRPNAEVANS